MRGDKDLNQTVWKSRKMSTNTLQGLISRLCPKHAPFPGQNEKDSGYHFTPRLRALKHHAEPPPAPPTTTLPQGQMRCSVPPVLPQATQLGWRWSGCNPRAGVAAWTHYATMPMTCERYQLLPAIRFGAQAPELNQITLLTPSLLLHFHPVINLAAVPSQRRERGGEEEPGLPNPPPREPCARSRQEEDSNFEHLMGKFHLRKRVSCALGNPPGCQGQVWGNTYSPPNSSFAAAPSLVGLKQLRTL